MNRFKMRGKLRAVERIGIMDEEPNQSWWWTRANKQGIHCISYSSRIWGSLPAAISSVDPRERSMGGWTKSREKEPPPLDEWWSFSSSSSYIFSSWWLAIYATEGKKSSLSSCRAEKEIKKNKRKKMGGSETQLPSVHGPHLFVFLFFFFSPL